MSDEKLKPCPFCGGEGELDNGAPHNPADWCVGCRACDYSLEFTASHTEATAAWNTRSEPPADLKAAVEALEPFAKAALFVAQQDQDWFGVSPDDFERAAEVYAALNLSETPAPGSLALGALPEGGEERNSSSVDESGGSPPAAAKSDGQSSAGWRDIASAPKDGARVDLFDGRNINERCWWAAMELDGYGWANSWTGFCPTHWRPYTPAECSANSPSANGASAGNSGLDEPLPPALPYSAASRP